MQQKPLILCHVRCAHVISAAQCQQQTTYTVVRDSGVVSGTTVRALVLGRFSQKKIKNRIER